MFGISTTKGKKRKIRTVSTTTVYRDKSAVKTTKPETDQLRVHFGV